MSHPHGCVSWNALVCVGQLLCAVTPSRVCELKWYCHRIYKPCLVTPSRVCELKFSIWFHLPKHISSHPHGCVSWNIFNPCGHRLTYRSHPHGCVSWNTYIFSDVPWNFLSHPHGCVSWNSAHRRHWREKQWSHPHGCVSWNIKAVTESFNAAVTPSRVCELKLSLMVRQAPWNFHTLTGVWVEMCLKPLTTWALLRVTPSRVCELK